MEEVALRGDHPLGEFSKFVGVRLAVTMTGGYLVALREIRCTMI